MAFLPKMTIARRLLRGVGRACRTLPILRGDRLIGARVVGEVGLSSFARVELWAVSPQLTRTRSSPLQRWSSPALPTSTRAKRVPTLPSTALDCPTALDLNSHHHHASLELLYWRLRSDARRLVALKLPHQRSAPHLYLHFSTYLLQLASSPLSVLTDPTASPRYYHVNIHPRQHHEHSGHHQPASERQRQRLPQSPIQLAVTEPPH